MDCFGDDAKTTTVTGPDGRQQRIVLNDALLVESAGDPAVPDEDLAFEYDADGALVSLDTPKEHQHTWQHTDGGRMASYAAPPTVALPNGSTTTYEWAVNGRPREYVEPDGRAVQFAYDDEGRPTQVTYPDPLSAQQPAGLVTTTMGWRPDHRPLRTTLPTQTLLGGTNVDVVEEPVYDLDEEEPEYSGTLQIGRIQRLTVNGVSRKMRLRTHIDADAWRPDELTVIDNDGVEHDLAVALDADGVLQQIGALNIDTVSPGARGVGLPASDSVGNINVVRDFSAFGELDEVTVKHGEAERFQQTIVRSPAGKMIGVVRCTTDVVETCVTWTFTYDAGDRLETATSTDGQSYVYAYDPNGNRTSRTAGAAIEQDAVIDAQDRLLEYAGAEFTYNAMGQMTTAIGRPNGDWTYTYDVMGSLRRAHTAGTDIEYVVDSAGRRIGRRENGGAFTWWMYQGLHPIAEFDSQMRLTKVFVYGAEGHTPAYMATINAGAVTGRYRFVTDQVGSVVGLLDEQGQWAERSSYTPFGRRTVVQAAPAALAHPFGFAGGIDEPATELVRFGARDYDPWTGRWTAKDPIRFEGGTANLYEYAFGDPSGRIDPTGLAPPSADVAIGYAVLAGNVELVKALGGSAFAISVATTMVGDLSFSDYMGACMDAVVSQVVRRAIADAVPIAWPRAVSCHAKCNVAGPLDICTGQVSGPVVSGKNGGKVCRAAKKLVNDVINESYRGCYKRHCQCIGNC